MTLPVCRSCGAPVKWARIAASGRSIPLDPVHRRDGNVRAVGSDERGALIVEVGARGSGPYVSHFATCVNAAQHRKAKR